MTWPTPSNDSSRIAPRAPRSCTPPGSSTPDQIERLVKAVDAPVNVLAMRAGPSVPELEALGVRRVSTGGGLARVAYGALLAAGRELRHDGDLRRTWMPPSRQATWKRRWRLAARGANGPGAPSGRRVYGSTLPDAWRMTDGSTERA